MIPVRVYLVLAAVAVVIGAVWYTYSTVYSKGFEAGKVEVQAQLDKERKQWESKVAGLQTGFETSIEGQKQAYLKQVESYQNQITYLRRNPTIVNRYVPGDTQCNITRGFVELHDTAAKGVPLADRPKSVEPTNIRLDQVSSLVAENYYSCNQIRDQLIGLQAIVKQYQEAQKGLK